MSLLRTGRAASERHGKPGICPSCCDKRVCSTTTPPRSALRSKYHSFVSETGRQRQPRGQEACQHKVQLLQWAAGSFGPDGGLPRWAVPCSEPRGGRKSAGDRRRAATMLIQTDPCPRLGGLLGFLLRPSVLPATLTIPSSFLWSRPSCAKCEAERAPSPLVLQHPWHAAVRLAWRCRCQLAASVPALELWNTLAAAQATGRHQPVLVDLTPRCRCSYAGSAWRGRLCARRGWALQG